MDRVRVRCLVWIVHSGVCREPQGEVDGRGCVLERQQERDLGRADPLGVRVWHVRDGVKHVKHNVHVLGPRLDVSHPLCVGERDAELKLLVPFRVQLSHQRRRLLHGHGRRSGSQRGQVHNPGDSGRRSSAITTLIPSVWIRAVAHIPSATGIRNVGVGGVGSLSLPGVDRPVFDADDDIEGEGFVLDPVAGWERADASHGVYVESFKDSDVDGGVLLGDGDFGLLQQRSQAWVVSKGSSDGGGGGEDGEAGACEMGLALEKGEHDGVEALVEEADKVFRTLSARLVDKHIPPSALEREGHLEDGSKLCVGQPRV